MYVLFIEWEMRGNVGQYGTLRRKENKGENARGIQSVQSVTVPRSLNSANSNINWYSILTSVTSVI